MCYYIQNKASTKALIERFNASFKLPKLYQPQNEISAFAGEQLPIITHEDKSSFEFADWGLIPNWAKDEEIASKTKNARIETIHEKPSYRDCISQRCIIPATGFYEWKWHDSKGKQKEKFLIYPKEHSIFAFAGLCNLWTDPHSQKSILTFTILTSAAEGIMKDIHNTKQRMPLIINPSDEKKWLENKKVNFITDFDADSLTPMNLKFDF